MMKRVKLFIALSLQLFLIASIGDFVGWPYMEYVLYAAVFFFLLSLLMIIVHFAKED